MKKFFLLTAFIIICGCSNDDGAKAQQIPITVQNILGTWTAISVSGDSGTGQNDFEPIPENDRYSITFFENSTFKNIGNEECDGIYILEADDRQLTLDYQGSCTNDSFNYIISSLTNDEMILRIIVTIEGNRIKFKKNNL